LCGVVRGLGVCVLRVCECVCVSFAVRSACLLCMYCAWIVRVCVCCEWFVRVCCT
jgi:hypothetical protein